MIHGRAISELCRDLAESAARDQHDVLAQILRMAALEAAQTGARFDRLEPDIRQRLVGTWDWDIVNDLVYADGSFASLFGISDEDAARGAPLKRWAGAVHPDDLDELNARIVSTIRTGQVFEMEYRVVARGEVHWVYARGQCTFDQAGHPIRFPGAIVDITHEKTHDHHFSIAPQ